MFLEYPIPIKVGKSICAGFLVVRGSAHPKIKVGSAASPGPGTGLLRASGLRGYLSRAHRVVPGRNAVDGLFRPDTPPQLVHLARSLVLPAGSENAAVHELNVYIGS